MTKRKAVFLDRDGVINHDSGYVYKASELSFIDGVFDACYALQKAGYALVVVTNQSGVARGFYTERDVIVLHEWMHREFWAHDVNIDQFYFCPHHKVDGLGDYRKDCQCRKPKPGMLLKASEDFALDLSQSIMIGDRESDVIVGQNAGVRKTVWISSSEHNLTSVIPDYVCLSLKDFTDNHLSSLLTN